MFIAYGLAAIIIGISALENGIWGALIASGFLMIAYQIGLWAFRFTKKSNWHPNFWWMIGYDGRINRQKYWGGMLTLMIPLWIIGFSFPDVAPLFLTLFAFAASPLIIKRLHDVGKSGWFWLLCYIPIVSLYPGILMAFCKGDSGPNKYGKDPLGSEQTAPDVEKIESEKERAG